MTTRLLAAGLALLALAGAAPAQVAGQVPFHGSEFFRFALHLKELKPVSTPREALRSPTASVIVIFGDAAGLGPFFSEADLRAFFMRGGAILLATDYPTEEGFGWEEEFDFSIARGSLTAAPRDCFGITSRPFVRPLDDLRDRGRIPQPGLFEGVPERGERAVATDHPAELTLKPDRRNLNRVRLAGYPSSARRRSGEAVPEDSLFAVSLRPLAGPGRMLVLADSDVFANGMMGFEEEPTQPNGYRLKNGNWGFANRTIDWLKEGPFQLRTQCLFIEDGEIKNQFAVQLPNAPRPPVPDIPPEVIANWLLRSANGIIQERQEQNALNRALLQRPGLHWFLRAFLIAVTALFLLYGLRWLTRGYRKAEPAAATGPAQQAALLPRGGVLRQRTAAQIEVGNLAEAAGRRIRDRFDVLGGRPGPAGAMPSVLVANDVADAPLLRQAVRRLWEIGYGETRVNVPPTEWDRVNGLLERVTARAARGDWSFGQDVA